MTGTVLSVCLMKYIPVLDFNDMRRIIEVLEV